MKRFNLLFVVLFGLSLLAGCETTPSKEGDGRPGAGTGIEGTGADMGGSVSTYSLDDPASPLARRVIYFDYDSATLKDEDRQLIEHHSRYLADHPETQLVLEGHTDERGSREYNIALGERRSAAVKQIMQLLGVTEAQMQTISFGEERPVAPGHDESAWQLNRRVELLYSEHR